MWTDTTNVDFEYFLYKLKNSVKFWFSISFGNLITLIQEYSA